MRQAEEWISALRGGLRLVSQAELAASLNSLAVPNPLASDGYVGFLDGEVFASSRDENFRETAEFTVDCVLDSDLREYLEMSRRGDASARALVTPAPRRFAQTDRGLPGGLYLAPSSHYSPLTGFHEEKVQSA
jgi:hypothetical protein